MLKDESLLSLALNDMKSYAFYVSACLTEAERVSDMHSRIRDGLMSQVHTSIGQWKTDHYHKSFFSWKETKTADDGFEKAQRPWTKRLAKVEKYRKLYHQSAKATEQVCWWRCFKASAIRGNELQMKCLRL